MGWRDSHGANGDAAQLGPEARSPASCLTLWLFSVTRPPKVPAEAGTFLSRVSRVTVPRAVLRTSPDMEARVGPERGGSGLSAGKLTRTGGRGAGSLPQQLRTPCRVRGAPCPEP